MLGAIIGDIVGSRFEITNLRSKEFDLFTDECSFTDDSVMTLAVAKALMETGRIRGQASGKDEDYYRILCSQALVQMQEVGRRYPYCGYSRTFRRWIFSSNPEPYDSYGNGAAMRISPVGCFASTEEEVILMARAVTGVSHSHEEGLKGAEATAMAIFMARKGHDKESIRKRICSDYYSLDFTIDGIRDSYTFDATCQGSVPQAIKALLESDSFEDAIRTAVSLGGDSDTIAAIAGSIAEAYYGIPEELKLKAITYLDDYLLDIYRQWKDFSGGK